LLGIVTQLNMRPNSSPFW